MNEEALIKRIGGLTHACSTLAKTIAAFEHVLIKENEAIERSDIKELEAITQEKIFFGTKIEEGVAEIRKQMNYLHSHLDFEKQDKDSLQIENLVETLRALPPSFSPSFAQLDQAISSLESSMDELKQARTAVFPKIEANAYMVKKLLQYHRETYAFWQAVAQQSEAVYGKTGKAVTGTQRSILSVRT